MSSINIFFLFILVIFLGVAFSIFDRDILSPTVVVSALFVVCTVLYILNAKKWESELSIKTIGVIISGLFVFAIVEFIVSSMYKKKSVGAVSIIKQFKTIRIDKWKLAFLVVFSLVTTGLYYKEVIRIYSMFGSQYGNNVMQVFRMASSHSNQLDASEMVNPLVVQLSKVMMVSAYVSMYVFINNVICCKDSIKKNVIYILFCGIYIVESLISSGRVQLIYFLAAAIVMTYVLWHQKIGWKKNISYKFIAIGFVCFVAFITVFYNIRYIVGRSQDTMNLFEYISMYAGAPICLLNAFVGQNQMDSALYFGEETFVGMHTFLYKIGLVDSYRSIQLEFRYVNGVGLGNVYTFFRRPLHDFGWIGMLVLTALFAFVYCYVYYMIVKRNNSRKRWGEIPILLYAMWFYPLVLFPIDNCIYQVVTMGNVLSSVLLVGMSIFLLHTRVKFFR